MNTTKTATKGIDLQLPSYILKSLVPDADEKGISSQALIKKILKEYYEL